MPQNCFSSLMQNRLGAAQFILETKSFQFLILILASFPDGYSIFQCSHGRNVYLKWSSIWCNYNLIVCGKHPGYFNKPIFNRKWEVNLPYFTPLSVSSSHQIGRTISFIVSLSFCNDYKNLLIRFFQKHHVNIIHPISPTLGLLQMILLCTDKSVQKTHHRFSDPWRHLKSRSPGELRAGFQFERVTCPPKTDPDWKLEKDLEKWIY